MSSVDGPPLLLVRGAPPPLALDMKLARRSCCPLSRCSSCCSGPCTEITPGLMLSSSYQMWREEQLHTLRRHLQSKGRYISGLGSTKTAEQLQSDPI